MVVKEDFMSLFDGHEAEISGLHDRFPIRDFSYMITSQRTMYRVYGKLNKIVENRVTGHEHGNFWADLQTLGLVKRNPNRISEFGKTVYIYFQKETDPFKREHFILINIKDRKYDIDTDIQRTYQEKVSDLESCLEIIPILNQRGNELLNNPEKLLITGFLNVFPYALRRYYNLSTVRQRAIDSLHESGLTDLFDSNDATEIKYHRIAQRLLNNWRALDRRINFVKSVILSNYEDAIEASDSYQISYAINPSFNKILNETILDEIISKSDIIQTATIDDEKIIRKKFRDPNHSIIVEDFTIFDNERIKHTGEEISRRILSPDEQREAQELTNERTRQHDAIVKKVAMNFSPEEGYIIRTDPVNFDLLIEKDDKALLFEMKTLKPRSRPDERKQIIRGLGQLFYYEHMITSSVLTTSESDISKFMVLQRKPLDLRHIDFLKTIGINVLWLTEEQEISGEDESLEIYNNF